MDDIIVTDITAAGPCEDLAAYEPEELPAAARRLYREILGGFVQEHPEVFQ